jgi:hypothetical protein
MSDLIASIPAEADNLSLHVQLCEQRYLQLLSKFDDVDRKFTRIESTLLDIKNTIEAKEEAHTEKYLKWAGVIIGLLGTFSLGLVTHLLFK